MEVRFFAGAAEAAGIESTVIDATGLTGDGLVELLAADNEHLERVLRVSSLLADGVRVADRSAALGNVRCIDVLPPFAGG